MRPVSGIRETESFIGSTFSTARSIASILGAAQTGAGTLERTWVVPPPGKAGVWWWRCRPVLRFWTWRPGRSRVWLILRRSCRGTQRLRPSPLPARVLEGLRPVPGEPPDCRPLASEPDRPAPPLEEGEKGDAQQGEGHRLSRKTRAEWRLNSWTVESSWTVSHPRKAGTATPRKGTCTLNRDPASGCLSRSRAER